MYVDYIWRLNRILYNYIYKKCKNSLNPHKNPIRYELLLSCPLYRWENWCTERLSNLLRITQPEFESRPAAWAWSTLWPLGGQEADTGWLSVLWGLAAVVFVHSTPPGAGLGFWVGWQVARPLQRRQERPAGPILSIGLSLQGCPQPAWPHALESDFPRICSFLLSCCPSPRWLYGKLHPFLAATECPHGCGKGVRGRNLASSACPASVPRQDTEHPGSCRRGAGVSLEFGHVFSLILVWTQRGPRTKPTAAWWAPQTQGPEVTPEDALNINIPA